MSYKTTDGTATSPSDYIAATLTQLNFDPTGSRTQTVAVNVNGDTTVEKDETFSLDLSANDSGSFLGTSSAAATIKNDETAAFSINSPAAVTEGGNIVFQVTLSNPLDTAATLNVTFNDISTSAGDFDHTTQQVTFAAGVFGTKTVTLSPTDDNIVEGTENVERRFRWMRRRR